jgi:phage tail-like protein
MPVVGNPRNYDKKFLFGVEIDGLTIAWFTTVSGLEGEGGQIGVADKSPGLVEFPEVTLTVGATDNRELYDWWLQVINAAANSGLPDAAYKKNVSIVQTDRDGTVKKRWDLYEAWPSKFKAGEWDANAEENVMQEITLTYKYFDLTQS